MELKVGDTVRYLRTSAGIGKKGILARVTKVINGAASVEVKHLEGDEQGPNWGAWASDLELVTHAIMDDTREYLAAVTGGEP